MSPRQKRSEAHEAIRQARENAAIAAVHGSTLVGEKAEAATRAKAAHEQAQAALADKVLGKSGAEERYAAAVAERQQAIADVARLDEEDQEALRIRRGEEERIRQIRVLHWESLRDEPEAAVAEVQERVRELVGPLRAYIAAWSRAASGYGELRHALVEHLLAQDRANGEAHDLDSLRTLASVPQCPLPASAVVAVLNAVPRPLILNGHKPKQYDDGVRVTDAPSPVDV